MIPQVDSSFLDRLLEMRGESNDLKFRQDMTDRIVRFGMEQATLGRERAYYEDMVAGMNNLGKLKSDKNTVQQVESRTSLILNELLRALEQLQAVYDELSAHNLNPRTILYSVSSAPLVSSERSVSLRLLFLSSVACLVLVLVLTILACLTYDALGGRRSDAVRVQEQGQGNSPD
jgi:hypothetical protein